MLRDARLALRARRGAPTAPAAGAPAPLGSAERSRNELRPPTFGQMIGQQKAVGYLRRVIEASEARGRQLDHILLIGPSGVGKSTVANVIANELTRRGQITQHFEGDRVPRVTRQLEPPTSRCTRGAVGAMPPSSPSPATSRCAPARSSR